MLHQNKFNFSDEILPELLKIVGDNYFVPIGFCSTLNSCYFFVHDQGKALEKLFERNLRLDIRGHSVSLTVKFCVADFKQGMIRPKDKLLKVIEESIERSNPYLSNLNNIASHKHLTDIIFSLNSVSSLRLFFDQFFKARNILSSVTSLDLSNNGIKFLQPFTNLKLNIRTLILKHNKIESIDELNFLKHLRIEEIFFVGNPIMEQPGIMNNLQRILPNLKKIDEFEVDIRSPPPTSSFVNHSPPQHNRIDAIRTSSLNRKSNNSNGTGKVFRSIEIDDYVKKEFPKHRNDMWNRVIVEHNGKVTKETILDEMNKQFFNLIEFYPCYYERHEKQDTFLLYKNFSAIERLIQSNLQMKIPSMNCKITFELNIKSAEKRDDDIDWRTKIKSVIAKRMQGSLLNLDDFVNDTGLMELEVTLSTIQGLSHVLCTAARDKNAEIEFVNLQNNRISNCEGLKMLKNFPNLRMLDLRNNEIKCFANMSSLPSVVDIYMDRNPFCGEFYESPWRYVRELRKTFPNLESCDGRHIENSGQLVGLQNFFVSSNLYTLSESFINFYFGIYDSHNRFSLRALYDTNSLFTVSCDAATNENRIINSHTNYSRNLLPLQSGEANEKVFKGSEIILTLFGSFTETQHDFATLCVDVPMFTDKHILITTSGYFKELRDKINDDELNIFGFSRSFLLERKDQKSGTMAGTYKYVIKNEQLQIRSISSEEMSRAFKQPILTKQDVQSKCREMLPTNKQESSVLMLREFTNLERKLCER